MEGTLVGNGQCVTFVYAATTIPPTYAWRKGAKFKGNYAIARGTVIAVFGADVRYSNFVGGSSKHVFNNVSVFDGPPKNMVDLVGGGKDAHGIPNISVHTLFAATRIPKRRLRFTRLEQDIVPLV